MMMLKEAIQDKVTTDVANCSWSYPGSDGCAGLDFCIAVTP